MLRHALLVSLTALPPLSATATPGDHCDQIRTDVLRTACQRRAAPAAPAHAEPGESCAGIASDLARLRCYDAKFRPAAPTPSRGQWSVRSEKSHFEDTTDVFMRLRSQGAPGCGFGGLEKATLVLRCLENKTSIYIATTCHLASGFHGYGKVDIRLDDGKAFRVDMEESTDNRALGLWGGSEAIGLVKRMLGKDRMIARFTPFSESPVTVQFEIAGLDEAIKPLRDSCKW